MRPIRDNPVIARSAPFLLFVGFLVLGSLLPDAAAGQGAVTASSSWLVVGRGAAVALALAWFWRGYGELRSTAPAHPAHWLVAVLAGLVAFLVWISLDQGWAVLSDGRRGFAPVLPDGGTDWPKALARLAGFALVVPVMEELFWRSLLLRWIERHEFLAVDPRRIGTRAFVITTVLFAVEHDRWFAGAVAGALYNWLYMRSGNLWVAILAHAVSNAALGVWILQTRQWQFW
jgi:CAAX prenyl protease-like protein